MSSRFTNMDLVVLAVTQLLGLLAAGLGLLAGNRGRRP